MFESQELKNKVEMLIKANSRMKVEVESLRNDLCELIYTLQGVKSPKPWWGPLQPLKWEGCKTGVYFVETNPYKPTLKIEDVTGKIDALAEYLGVEFDHEPAQESKLVVKKN